MSDPGAASAMERVRPGVWGGEHVAMTVTDSGAHLEFDCASGDIAAPLATDRGGRFVVEGIFVRERAGAIRPGQEPERHRARYEGLLKDETVTLEVVLIDSDESIGRFTLAFGATPRVRKCR